MFDVEHNSRMANEMTGTSGKKIEYSPEQKRIVSHRKGHLQVVACAGSGKTETVSARVAKLLLEDSIAPEGIVAFTFTNAAADSLKSRILRKVHERDGSYNLDKLSPMYVGTIHSFCLRFLQEHVPKYAAFDLFEDHRLVGLLNREFYHIGLQALGPELETKNQTAIISAFLETADVVENEMLNVGKLPTSSFRKTYEKYIDLLERYRVLTHNQCITRAVAELEKPKVLRRYHQHLRQLIVDEFQDVNPAQARLIQLLGGGPVEVCVVGDDDQSIFQWRGSSVEYIRDFKRAFGAKRETLALNRRSREPIIKLASKFASTIPKRLEKDIRSKRTAGEQDVNLFVAPTAVDEAKLVAGAIKRMRAAGIAYKDIAILLRSVRTSSSPFREVFEAEDIPYSCGGRTGLFLQPEASLMGQVFEYLAGREEYWDSEKRTLKKLDLKTLLASIARVFRVKRSELEAARKQLEALRSSLPEERHIDLIDTYYGILHSLGVHRWNIADEVEANRMGVLARFSELLADYESVTRRARHVDDENGKGMRGGISQGPQYLNGLVNYISYYARRAYDDFDGEETFDTDAVVITTVHQAKGLEWPVVFVPCLTDKRFPSGQTGSEGAWLIPRKLFPASRYEGSEADERRLFYVAITRARDVLYLSRHDRVTKNRVGPSPFFEEVGGKRIDVSTSKLWTPTEISFRPQSEEDKPTFSFSELAAYRVCPHGYRLQLILGFQPSAPKELGYGKGVHHILRRVSDHRKEKGKLPKAADVDQLFEEEFYLPYADRPAYEQMRAKARKLVDQYLTDYADDLERVWEVERSFELHLPEANVSGRADVILDKEGGEIDALAIVDYKTKPDPKQEELHHLQLAIYTGAARGEGFDVRAAYLHDLSAPKPLARTSVPADGRTVEQAKSVASALANGIRAGQHKATVGSHCKSCDVKKICRHA